MDTRGRHLLAEYFGCDLGLLDDPEALRELLEEAARVAGSTPVRWVSHHYRPQGVTGVLVIEESHLSIHTWPEHGYAAVDFFTCGRCRPELAHEHLAAELGAEQSEIMVIRRGLGPGEGFMKIEVPGAAGS